MITVVDSGDRWRMVVIGDDYGGGWWLHVMITVEDGGDR